MGRDKAMMMWNDKTLLDHMIQLLSTAADPVRVVGRAELPDRLPGKGPLGGILTALEVTETDRNLILGTDLPLLTSNFLNSFRHSVVASEHEVVACNIGGMYPLCLGICKSAYPFVVNQIASGKLAIQEFVRRANAEILDEKELADAGFDPSIFANLNTPEEFNRLSGKK
jgi:molybdenum cofactor guanylyltransferase